MYAYDTRAINPSQRNLKKLIKKAGSIKIHTNGSRVYNTLGSLGETLGEYSYPKGYHWFYEHRYEINRTRRDTNVVGVAWFTDRRERKHVRVIGGTVAADQLDPYNFPRVFGLPNDTLSDAVRHASLAYPILYIPYVTDQPTTLIESLRAELSREPLDLAAWCALHDVLEDAGQDNAYCILAIRTIQGLQL